MRGISASDFDSLMERIVQLHQRRLRENTLALRAAEERLRRTCAVCGSSLGLRRIDALTCSNVCRTRSYRRRLEERRRLERGA